MTTLKGKAAKEFIKQMMENENKKATPEEVAEIKKGADAVKKIMAKSKMVIQMEYKAYGVYIGNYAGGTVSTPLYFSIDKAREEGLKEIDKINEVNKLKLKKAIDECDSDEELIKYSKEMFAPMEEIGKDIWTNEIDFVEIREFEIK